MGFAIGVPLAWAVVLLLHPTGEGDDFYPVIADEVTPWLVVHVATLLFVPLLGAVVFLLLRGVEGTAARVSRVALASFVVFYTAWEVVVGIGLGVLTDEVNALPAADRATGASLVEGFADSGLVRVMELVGTGSLLVALTAAGIAFRGAGASIVVPALFVLAAIPIAWHVTPFGQFGLALFVVAVVVLVRRGTVAVTDAGSAVRPGPAASVRRHPV